MTSKTRKTQKQTKQVAFNPITRRWQEVFAEDEVPANKIVTLYWSASLEKWVTVA